MIGCRDYGERNGAFPHPSELYGPAHHCGASSRQVPTLLAINVCFLSFRSRAAMCQDDTFVRLIEVDQTRTLSIFQVAD